MDDEFLSGFFRHMRPRLFQFARRRLDVETAHEVALEAMVTLWRKGIPNPTDETELRQLQSLAYRVVEGHMRNALRSKKQRENLNDALEAQLRVGVGEHDETVEHAVPAATTELIAKMSQSDREVLSLYIDGYRTAEIAEILGCSPKAASMRLARARKNLQTLAGEVMEDECGI